MADESIIKEAFNALRDPASDPDGFGRSFFLTTINVNGTDRWAICAKAGDTAMPLFFALIPGDRVRIEGRELIVEDGIGPGRPV